jgi:ParB-like chromosome segregation protein Spo0J
MLRIETIEQYHALKPSLAPVIIAAKQKQEILIPCVNVLLVRRELVQANHWNPNQVPDDKMELLRQSIVDNGFCFPIVTGYDPDLEKFIVVDGFHRYTIAGPNWLDMAYVPIVVLDRPIEELMAATWQFNKARGVHEVDRDADLIRSLLQQGKSEDEISVHLGIDLDTVFRYKQMTGIAELFLGADYSMSWGMVEVDR